MHTIYNKKLRVNSSIYPKAEIVDQKAHLFVTGNGRCEFTTIPELKEKEVPVDFVLDILEHGINAPPALKCDDFFTNYYDKNGNLIQFLIHLHYEPKV